jgi:hypothetical protein
MSPEAIKEKARQINEASLNYHQAHAVFACNKILEDSFDKYVQVKEVEIKNQLEVAEKRGDHKRRDELLMEKDRLGRPYRIYVDYVPNMDIEGGRVIKLTDSNQLVISLPEGLLKNSRNEDGTYNPNGVKKLRKRMAHELGHIALHIDKLLEIDGTQGAFDLSEEAEKEAETFATELIRLRRERNKEIYKNGLHKDIF